MMRKRLDFALSASRQFRDCAEGLELEHFPATKYSFGEPDIVPTTAARMRRVRTPLVASVSVEILFGELITDRLREPTPRSKSLISPILIIEHGDRASEELNVFSSK